MEAWRRCSIKAGDGIGGMNEKLGGEDRAWALCAAERASRLKAEDVAGRRRSVAAWKNSSGVGRIERW